MKNLPWINQPDWTEPGDAPALFRDRYELTPNELCSVLETAMSSGADFAELFFEYRISNSLRMEEDIIKESSRQVTQGVGIRVIKGTQTGYAFTNDLGLSEMKRTASVAAAVAEMGRNPRDIKLRTSVPERNVYDPDRLITSLPLEKRIPLVEEAYRSSQSYHKNIGQVQVSMSDEMQAVMIANSEGLLTGDIRPQFRLSALATATKNGIRTSGFSSGGGRAGLGYFESQKSPGEIGRKAAEEALLLLEASDPIAGEQPVILGSGQSGVLVHEALGHLLEADANRKKTSILWDKMGQKIASPLVTIADDPTMHGMRGSYNIDDEGIVPACTVLVDHGRMVEYLQDRLSAKLMNAKQNGHGRRSHYEVFPIPRMGNTFLMQGEQDPEDIVRSVRKGFFASTFQGGQVQDTGKFTFSVNLGYWIEEGRLTRPVRNATLIGDNLKIMNDIEMVGNDMGFFLGTCGKEGQSVPVTAGTPTLKIRSMTVGGRS